MEKVINKIKEMLVSRGIAFIFSVISLVCAFVMLIVYMITGVNEFNAELSGKLITLISLTIAAGAVFTVFEVKLGKYLVSILALWSWAQFISTQVNYLSNILVAIDGSTISVEFVLTLVLGIAAWAAALVSGILQKNELGSGKAKKAEAR